MIADPALAPTPPLFRLKSPPSTRKVAIGTSLGQLLEEAGISTTRASLLDIDGELLKRHAVEPTYGIDGEPATLASILHAGDAVSVRPAKDTAEGLERERIIGGLPSNPEFAMGGDRGVYVVESGKDSGKIASVTFEEGKGRYQPRVVALTFDDGPDPEMTPLILHILAREEVPATFFVTGQQAAANPDLIRQILAGGHAIGTHSWSHPTQPHSTNSTAPRSLSR